MAAEFTVLSPSVTMEISREFVIKYVQRNSVWELLNEAYKIFLFSGSSVWPKWLLWMALPAELSRTVTEFHPSTALCFQMPLSRLGSGQNLIDGLSSKKLQSHFQLNFWVFKLQSWGGGSMKGSMSWCVCGGKEGEELQSCVLWVRAVCPAVLLSSWKILGGNSQFFNFGTTFTRIVLVYVGKEIKNETLPHLQSSYFKCHFTSVVQQQKHFNN